MREPGGDTFFSNNIDSNHSISIEKVKIKLATVDPITPTTGHAGTVVTISGTGFTATSVVTLGPVSIPPANIHFHFQDDLLRTLFLQGLHRALNHVFSVL